MREQAITIFQSAVQAVQPQHLLPRHIMLDDKHLELGGVSFLRDGIRHIYVIGAGKASAAMARETELILGNAIAEGIVVTKYDHGLPLQYIRCLEAGHPIPDDAGIAASEEIMALLQKADDHDVVIALISGGASALLIDCPPGATLAEVQEVFGKLLASGASIGEMNIVRKHLSSGIKGGQLVRKAWPADVVSFILSDVPGDDLESIASGPTVPDTSYCSDAWKILEKYHLIDQLPDAITDHLQKGMNGEILDTPKPGDAIFSKTHNYLIGTNQVALDAAKEAAEKIGYHAVVLAQPLTGEAREMAERVLQYVADYNGPRPACLLLGGETTVTIKGNGTGGRNQELALAALVQLKNGHAAAKRNPVLLSAGTDGTDGPTDAAGAVIDAATLEKVAEKKLSPGSFLAANDSYNFFKQAGGHIITGATQTNVMDVVVVLIP